MNAMSMQIEQGTGSPHAALPPSPATFYMPGTRFCRVGHHTVDDRNPASPYIHIDVLYYQNTILVVY